MDIFKVTNLKKYFPITKGLLRRNAGFVPAVDDITFSVVKGETVGIVGESGSGKTTLARLLLKLLPATSGTIEFEGTDITNTKNSDLMDFRRRVQIVFQDPYSSLNPRMDIAAIVGEGLVIHKLVSTRRQKQKRTQELLETVGLNPGHLHRYPHQFSGGQRQRIGIARALSVNPEVIILDEPVSSLDVSVQAQILNLLADLQDKFGLTYLFIAHDLRVVEHQSSRVLVMYRGEIVESGGKDSIYTNPCHPYTRLLLDSIPQLDPTRRSFPRIPDDKDYLNSTAPLSSGCRFAPRCPKAVPLCDKTAPSLLQIEPGHFASCHLCKKEY